MRVNTPAVRGMIAFGAVSQRQSRSMISRVTYLKTVRVRFYLLRLEYSLLCHREVNMLTGLCIQRAFAVALVSYLIVKSAAADADKGYCVFLRSLSSSAALCF